MTGGMYSMWSSGTKLFSFSEKRGTLLEVNIQQPEVGIKRTILKLMMNNNQKDSERDQKDEETGKHADEEDEPLLHIVKRLSHGTYSDVEFAKLAKLESDQVLQTDADAASSSQEASQRLSGSVPPPSSDPYVHRDGQNQLDLSTINESSNNNDMEAQMMLKDRFIVGEANMHKHDPSVGVGRAEALQKDDAAAQMMLLDRFIVGEAAMHQKDRLVGAERAEMHQKNDTAAQTIHKDQFIVGEAEMLQKDRLVCVGRAKTQKKDQAVLDKAGINQGINQQDSHNLGGNRPNGLSSTAQNQEETELMPPGAYAVAPEGLRFTTIPTGTGTDTDEDLDEPIPQEPAPVSLEDGLPVANQVSDNLDLQVADLDRGQDSSRRAERKKQSLWLPALLYGSCVAALVIVVALLVNSGRNNQDTNSSVSDSPTYSPLPPENAQNLSDVELLVLEALSNHTLEALEDPNSPQSLAYEWMMEDLDENNYTHTSRIRQRYALATLFYATGGHDWYNNENWLNQSVHECFWFSQECTRKEDCTPCGIPPNLLISSNQAVHMDYNPYQHLLLYTNALQGTLPPEVFWLTNLKTIYLFKNPDLAGTISSHIARLRELEFFRVQVTTISGTIPTELGLLSDNLTDFHATNAQLEGPVPSELGLLHKLEKFSVDGNMLTGTIPEELGDATDLNFLVFIANSLSGTIPESIWHLSWHTLALGQNQLTGTIPTDIGLMSNLTYLSLAYNGFSGEIPSQIGLLTDVINVNLYFSSFTGTIPTEMGQLSSADYLGFSSCAFTGTIPTEVGLLTDLSLLWMDGNSLTGSIPSEIGQNVNLEGLSLGNTNLTGTLPSGLANAPLTMLFLENSLLSGSLPEGLGPDLIYLSLSNSTFLTGTIPQNLTSLDFVYVDGTELSGTLPEYLCGITDLVFDCSPLLCGCSCLCANETNSSAASMIVGANNETL
ncbi:LRR receptor-like serine threonine-protein kinase [Seminavis robusta]|uniref:LRR receptor-like serine threonine-protein kinase n=1 Tax=Seminavis robusta TaxID=568900 RepID=A0A9N8EZ87_9STRA|nr:LRR receptor-like serine threonine-protein kinase [Seminavis robusta]|eukprot:Sro1999_g310170.1 LRR receptor-like serine threonine-protein kinase (946) ;mRNA; r:15695-18532